MRRLSRVVWSEGMHLAQHHFQTQARYFEDSLRFALAHLRFAPFGLLSLELDHEALQNGRAALVRARGVMPDGVAFHFPDSDPTPDPLDVSSEFHPTEQSQLLTLSLPALRAGGANCGLGEGQPSDGLRYRAEEREVVDEVTGNDVRPVRIARKNFRLRLARDGGGEEEAGEAAEAESVGAPALEGVVEGAGPAEGDRLVSLPLARIRRDGAGRFVYDADFIPPCLSIGASPRIMQLLSGWVNLLRVKADALAGERPQGSSALAEYSAKEIAGYWLTHAIRSSLAPLEHHLQAGRAHPEELFRELLRLSGALCTFSLGSDPAELPVYRHEALHETFEALDRHIRDHLEVTLPTTCLTFPLQRHRKYIFLHTAEVSDPRAFGSAEWIVGLRSSLRQAELIREVPELVKFSSQEEIAARVKRGTGGLALEHLAAPPPALSPRVGTVYFRVHRSGPDWDSVQESRKVAVYVPEAITDPELELLVVLGG